MWINVILITFLCTFLRGLGLVKSRCVEPGRFANLPAKDEHVANNAPVIKTHKKPLARSKIRRWVLKPPRCTGKLSVVTPEDEGL
ncbi:uncharacterized [Tachysurus ichikawai]